MAYYVTSSETLTGLADAIREKGGTSEPLEFPDEFISAIGNITTGDNDVVFELVRDQTDTSLFVPTATYTEIMAALLDGKSVGLYCSDSAVNLAAQITTYSQSYGYIYYTTFEQIYNNDGYYTVLETWVRFASDGTAISSGSLTHYQTTSATALASHVKAGEVFFNEDGYAVGTATARSSSDLTASGATVTAPAGYYESSASKAVASGSATTPATTITANSSISVSNSGLITSTVSGSKSVTPTVSAGYVSSGTAGTVTVSGSNASQLSTQAAKTVTPTESAQTAVTAGKYTTGAVTVAAIPSDYVGSGIDQRSSSDLTVSGATVTAPAGYYSESASKAVATGTAGTPTATKGTVSNHTISVTPSVTNTTGYITGGTKTGTAVTVQASELVSGTKSITTNGTGIDVANYSTVDVAVSGDVPVYQAKTGIVPTENSQTITADTGYDALSSVQIDAIDSDYVGSGIDRRDDSDLTASGATVTVPAGYYEDTETKSVASGSATTPATTVTANPSISVSNAGLITATASATKSVTPTVSAGYVSSGTAGTITVSGSNTQQLSTQAATTYHPSTTDQTIASGKYLTGAQTIKAVTTTNLAPENILAGVTVKIGDSTDDDCVASVIGTASGGGGMVVVETTDEHGGTIVEITGEEIKLQAKTNISPTTSSQTIEPDNGYTGLSSVQINAMPSGSATAPASISGTSATVSTGTNTLTLTKTVSVTPSVTAGYVSSGTAGNSSVSLTASVTTKGTATITPTKSTQTIASGTYLTGTQTIAAIPAAYQDVTGVTAAAGDVVSGKSIVDSSGNTVNGSLVIQHYYTGSSAPSSSTGVNGDIYLQT